MRRSRTAAALLALALVAGCSGGDDGGSAADPDDETTTSDVVGDDAVAAAEGFLDGWERLDEEGRASLELGEVVEAPGVTHVHFRQVFDGPDGDPIPVRGAQVIVHVGDDGDVVGANSSYTDARPVEGVEQSVSEDEAVETAGKAAPGEVTETVSSRIVWLPDGDALRLGWSVIQATAAGGHQVWVDAVSGEVADSRRLRADRTASPVQADRGSCDDLTDADAPAACVFLPDPIHANDGETPDPDDTADLLTPEALLGLDDPESGELVGEFVDTDPPRNPVRATVEDDGLWTQGRGEPGFEAAMAYFWIDHVQRMIQDAGFTDVRNESFPVFPVDPEVEDNAFFDGAEQAIHLGVGPADGINEGEDANGIVHEYGHAVLDAQVPGMLGNTGDAGAYHEGFGDLLAFLTTLEFRGGDSPCLFAWTDQACLRRLDTDKDYPGDRVNEVHEDGEIYTGAVFDIVVGLLEAEGLTLEDCAGTDACNDVRDRVLATVLGSHEFLTGNERLPEIASAYLAANDAAFDGADADLLEAAFTGHGLDGGGGGTVDPTGDPGEVPAVEVRVDITHTFRGDLSIILHVVDGDFADLCTPIRLLAPDPQDGTPDVVGGVDISPSDCAELVPPADGRQWVLDVVDQADLDVGVVNSFQVVVEGAPFLATGVPATIADNDPTGTQVIVDGSRQTVPQEGSEDLQGDGDGPTASIAITHTFVGDLFLRVGVADPAGEVLCSVPVLEPDPADSSDDVEGAVDMGACTGFFPPSPDHRWFVEVVDTAAIDRGEVTAFAVFDAEGTLVAEAAGLPAAIPDDDPGGVRVAVPSS